VVRRHITTATYTGRRSGRTFSIPIGYRRSGDVVTIAVELPDRKNWWRNFTGEGGPLTLGFADGAHTGHAVARRDGRRVTITVDLARAALTRFTRRLDALQVALPGALHDRPQRREDPGQ
jgi:hypothetical protein